MKKLLSVFLIMFIVSCGIAYGGNSNENAIAISALEGHSYIVITPPMPMSCVFSFDESGNFRLSISGFGMNFESHSGYYTQTGFSFTAHAEFLGQADIPHEMDCEGISILGIFIFGKSTLKATMDDEVISGNLVFLGSLLPFRGAVE